MLFLWKSNYEVRTIEYKDNHIFKTHVSMFACPKDECLKAEWIMTIPNQGLDSDIRPPPTSEGTGVGTGPVVFVADLWS